ncbi:MAG: cupin domain-containing protein [Acidimicrobiales bacterium]
MTRGPGVVAVTIDDLGRFDPVDGSGARWSLPHGGDLDANLVTLAPYDRIGGHVNAEVDVLLYVTSGHGELLVEGTVHPLGPATVALVPRGAGRQVNAGPDGLVYLSVHRRRAPLAIGRPSGGPGPAGDGGEEAP